MSQDHYILINGKKFVIGYGSGMIPLYPVQSRDFYLGQSGKHELKWYDDLIPLDWWRCECGSANENKVNVCPNCFRTKP